MVEHEQDCATLQAEIVRLRSELEKWETGAILAGLKCAVRDASTQHDSATPQDEEVVMLRDIVQHHEEVMSATRNLRAMRLTYAAVTESALPPMPHSRQLC